MSEEYVTGEIGVLNLGIITEFHIRDRWCNAAGFFVLACI